MKAISRLYRFHVLIFLFVYLRMRPLICLFIRNRGVGGAVGVGREDVHWSLTWQRLSL